MRPTGAGIVHHRHMKAPDDDDPPIFQGQGRTLLGFLMAGFITSAAALMATGLWLVGQAQYLEDYCPTRVDPPEASTPEALSGRPAHWEDPVTVACEFDGFPTIYATEPAPLVGALLLAGAVVAIAFFAFQWARAERRRPPA